MGEQRRTEAREFTIVVDDLNEVWPWLLGLQDQHGDPGHVSISLNLWFSDGTGDETYSTRHVSFSAHARFELLDTDDPAAHPPAAPSAP